MRNQGWSSTDHSTQRSLITSPRVTHDRGRDEMPSPGRLNGEKERRAQVRMPADRQVGCRVPASPVEAALSDLSAEGCRIRMATPEFVQPGSTIVVHLGEGNEVACRVIWLDGNDIGLRFYEPLEAKGIARALGQPEPGEPLNAEKPGKRPLI